MRTGWGQGDGRGRYEWGHESRFDSEMYEMHSIKINLKKYIPTDGE